jgi:hypothetical protein
MDCKAPRAHHRVNIGSFQPNDYMRLRPGPLGAGERFALVACVSQPLRNELQ